MYIIISILLYSNHYAHTITYICIIHAVISINHNPQSINERNITHIEFIDGKSATHRRKMCYRLSIIDGKCATDRRKKCYR